MSKYRIGCYEDGSPKFAYLRKRKHYRTKFNGYTPIRRIMYFAHQIKWDGYAKKYLI
jgi:hypothetical protein